MILKYLPLLLVLLIPDASGQEPLCKGVHDEIAEMEGARHARLARVAGMHSASHFDVTYYRAEWNVDPAVRSIAGQVTTHFTMLQASDQIVLDLNDALTVAAVFSNGVPLPFIHTSHQVQITLPQPLQPGNEDSVRIVYSGVPPTSPEPRIFVSTTQGTPAVPAMWTLSEPFGSRDWWPCKNGLEDKADSIDIFLKHPTHFAVGESAPVTYRASSNGLLQSEIPDGSYTVTHWKHKYPIASYLVAFALTNYGVHQTHFDVAGESILMETYYYPQSETTFTDGAALTGDMMAFFSDKFGSYPFLEEKYGHTQFGWSGGMEHQTNSFMVNMGTTLVAHELAHQWFGNKITCGSWEDIWLNEGFAAYLTNLYLDHSNPGNALTRRQNAISLITGTSSDLGGSVKVDDVTSSARIFSSRLSYYKGAQLLHMLQWILGDTDFFQAINNYLNDPGLAFSFATTQDLKNHLEAASGKDLTYFFNQWYEGEGFPKYQVTWYPNGNEVQLTLSQTVPFPASVDFFQLPIPLLFKGANPGEEQLVVVNNSHNGQFFSETLGFVAVSVELDPERLLLTKNNIITQSNQALPVHVAAMAIACHESSPVISWETTGEVDAAYFEIQGSGNGITWTALGELAATGNVSNQYAFTAAVALPYYRIASYDLDGSVAYTAILAADCPAAAGLNLQPNPAATAITLKGAALPQVPFALRVRDQTGRTLFSRQIIPENSQYTLDISGLPPGVYHLTAESAGTSISRKFIKK